MSSLPRLTDADLDRLDELLSCAEMESSMTLDAIQGLLCAAASSPQPVPPEKWIPVVLGEGKFNAETQAKEVEQLLLRFHDDTLRQMAGEDGIDILSYPVEEGEEELALWCDGYLEGTQLAEPGWFEMGEDEEVVSELLYPFMLLSGRLKESALEEGEEWCSSKEERRLMDEAREAIAADIAKAYHFWFERRVNREPIKREAAKVGRNDPCPCGSGKKYKACHGAG
ncbi:MAG: UPF0149 family protein [Betaproteobacteria bacterium]|nr:UPF0149 family protein [Betaproteobacteria bacterium]